MKLIAGTIAAALLLAPMSAQAQSAPDAAATHTSFVRLAGAANAILVEPVKADLAKARIAILVVHPEHVNTFNYFIGRELPRYGYRVMMVNTYGPERTYDEFTAPIAAAIKALRALPGVEKVVLAGHSTGGSELTAYQDMAENGAKACQGPERIYKCSGKDLDTLPKADGLMLLDSNAGAVERTIALNPALPGEGHTDLDLYAAANGFDRTTKSASYKPDFLKRYFAAQSARANRLIDTALARLARIEKGEGQFRDDEPFVVAGSDLHVNGARPDLPDVRLLSRTHAPHVLLKADGTQPVQIITRIPIPTAKPDDQGVLADTVLNVTVRHYLSFEALRVAPDYALTETTVNGVSWRSTPNSVPGNVEGIHVPTLVMGATCAPHLVFSEIAYDRSAATDKTFVGLDGANHALQPCRPEYGDTSRRAFDYVDGWLSKPGRF